MYIHICIYIYIYMHIMPRALPQRNAWYCMRKRFSSSTDMCYYHCHYDCKYHDY